MCLLYHTSKAVPTWLSPHSCTSRCVYVLTLKRFFALGQVRKALVYPKCEVMAFSSCGTNKITRTLKALNGFT